MIRNGFVARYALVAVLAACVQGTVTSAPEESAPRGSSPPAMCGPVNAPYVVTVRITASQARSRSLPRFKEIVRETLCNRSSWVGSGKIRWKFQADGELRIGLWTATETEERCMRMIGLSVRYRYSCASSAAKEAVINGRAWDHENAGWPESDTLIRYRRMVINHEIGHTLTMRHPDPSRCAGNGMAPVMMQQSKSLQASSGETCRANPWPLPAERTALSPPSWYAR